MPTRNCRNRQCHVLLVEDDQSDTELVREALRNSTAQHELHVITDGVEAVQFVKRQEQHSSAPRPDLVILDLALPRQSGHDILQILKTDADLKSIPIVILSSSHEEKDIWRAYHLHANAYVVKPTNAQDFLSAVRHLAEFYLLHSELAPASQPIGNGGD